MTTWHRESTTAMTCGAFSICRVKSGDSFIYELWRRERSEPGRPGMGVVKIPAEFLESRTADMKDRAACEAARVELQDMASKYE